MPHTLPRRLALRASIGASLGLLSGMILGTPFGLPLARRATAAPLPTPGSAPMAAPAVLPASGGVTTRDLLGHTVHLPRTARRVVLCEGRQLGLLGLVHPNPVSVLAGWSADMKTALPQEYAAWRAQFPALEQLPVIGAHAGDDLPVEAILALQPDLVLFSRLAVGPRDGAGTSQRINTLVAAGVPVAVVDCMADPLHDTLRSLAILGTLLGQEERAQAFSAYYTERFTALQEWRRTTHPDLISVLIHRHAGGKSCCWSIASGSFADFVTEAGGRSIAAEVLPRPLGQLNLEWVLTHQPQAYLATGGVYIGRGGLMLGSGVASSDAARSLASIVADPALATLSAVQEGKVLGLWHGFNETPLHIVALEALARWLHPEARERFDPAASLARINRSFSALPMQGTYWTGLPA